jgi:hypothetical protein
MNFLWELENSAVPQSLIDGTCNVTYRHPELFGAMSPFQLRCAAHGNGEAVGR